MATPDLSPVWRLWTLGYTSVAPRQPARSDLERILASARRANPQLAVTGLLVHSEGTFMQMLEGPRDSVHEIFRRIRLDRLHTDIHVLFDQALQQREFKDWSMACTQVAPAQLEPLLQAPPATTRKMLAEYWQAWQSSPLPGALL